MKHTFVTVAHSGDFGMLHLQARSMDTYLDHSQVEEIIVVKNTVPEKYVPGPGVNRAMYGTLKNKVRIIEGNKVCDIPKQTPGWFSQQILKLAVSNFVNSTHYLLLDAKNHFVFPLYDRFLYAGDKIRSYMTDYRTHPLRPFLEKSLDYFQIKRTLKFLPPVTPFLVETDLARRLIKRIEQREGESFGPAFLKTGLTEFFALNAFILSCGYEMEEVYDLSGRQCPVIWGQYTESLYSDIAISENFELPFFSVHRSALDHFNARDKSALATFWKRRNLFKYISYGLSYLNDPNSFNWNAK